MKAFWTEARVKKFVDGELKSLIHATFDWAKVAEAHAMMDRSGSGGRMWREM